MTAITYTAKNSLVSGHTAGTSYDLEPKLYSHAPRFNSVGHTQQAIDGTKETNISRREKYHDLFIGNITESGLDNYYEFFDSVDGAESFTLDVSGSIASPVNAISVQLEGSPVITRLGTLDNFRIQLVVKEV